MKEGLKCKHIIFIFLMPDVFIVKLRFDFNECYKISYNIAFRSLYIQIYSNYKFRHKLYFLLYFISISLNNLNFDVVNNYTFQQKCICLKIYLKKDSTPTMEIQIILSKQILYFPFHPSSMTLSTSFDYMYLVNSYRKHLFSARFIVIYCCVGDNIQYMYSISNGTLTSTTFKVCIAISYMAIFGKGIIIKYENELHLIYNTMYEKSEKVVTYICCVIQ